MIQTSSLPALLVGADQGLGDRNPLHHRSASTPISANAYNGHAQPACRVKPLGRTDHDSFPSSSEPWAGGSTQPIVGRTATNSKQQPSRNSADWSATAACYADYDLNGGSMKVPPSYDPGSLYGRRHSPPLFGSPSGTAMLLSHSCPHWMLKSLVTASLQQGC